MARQMVVNYGFSDIGPWSLQDPSAQSGDMIMRMMAKNSISESLQKRIDDAVRDGLPCRSRVLHGPHNVQKSVNGS